MPQLISGLCKNLVNPLILFPAPPHPLRPESQRTRRNVLQIETSSLGDCHNELQSSDSINTHHTRPVVLNVEEEVVPAAAAVPVTGFVVLESTVSAKFAANSKDQP